MNNGTSTAEFVKISASFYDNNGSLVTVEDSYAPFNLEPNHRLGYTLLMKE